MIRAMTSPDNRAHAYAAALFVTALVVVAVLSFVILQPFLPAIAWAIVLAVAIRPLWVRIERRFPNRRSLAAAASSLLVAVVVLLPAVFFGTALAAQAAQATSRFGVYLRSQAVSSPGDLAALPVAGRAFEWLQTNAGVTPALVRQHAAEISGKLSGFIAAKGGGLVVGFFGAVGTFLLTLFLLFFLLRDGEEMAEAMSELLPLSPEERKKTMRRLGAMLESIFKGSLLTALVQGVLGGVGWALAGLPSPVLAAAAMAVLSLLPIGGTAFVWLPGAAVLALQGRTGAALFLFLWGAALVGSVDNFLRPKLVGGRTQMHDLMIFFSVLGGVQVFGMMGLLLGPVVFAITMALLAVFREAPHEDAAEAPGPAD